MEKLRLRRRAGSTGGTDALVSPVSVFQKGAGAAGADGKTCSLHKHGCNNGKKLPYFSSIASLGLLTARPGVASQHLWTWPDVTAVKPNLSRRVKLSPRWKVTVRDFFFLLI